MKNSSFNEAIIKDLVDSLKKLVNGLPEESLSGWQLGIKCFFDENPERDPIPLLKDLKSQQRDDYNVMEKIIGSENSRLLKALSI